MKSFSLDSFVFGVMIGILLVGVWFYTNTGGATLVSLNSASSVAEHATTTVPESGAVSVVDQQAGATVKVASVTVAPPGVWVAVRETTSDDLGNVLGAVRVSGPHTNVAITLLRETEPNRSYAVELYRDDNNGAFDPGVNSVYVDFNTGARVVAYFKTTD